MVENEQELQEKNQLNQLHITLQGKGGVGKSYVSSLIAQYMQDHNRDIVCIDTDPINATFSEYKMFNALRLNLMEGSKINERNFDNLMERIFNTNADFIIDNGAASFIPLSNYLIENQAVEMILDAGKLAVLHPVITGGQGLLDTLTGLDQLASQFSSRANIVVWLNEFFGDISSNGKLFEDMKVYHKHKDRISGIIRINKQNYDTFGKDVELMLNNRFTFDQAIESQEFPLMAKQRLKMVKKALWMQMDMIL